MARASRLIIKLTAGAQDAERVAQAFSVATTALASGISVSFWLTGEASWFALPGKTSEFSLPHSAPLDQMLATLIAETTVTLCTQCAVRRNINDGDQISGIRIAGSATFVEEIMGDATQALVY
ncbi:MAG: sulfur reduction protein DsrE [Streptomycetaceae bacterium]|nr:MAG: sulfur reduction protein DsrE [Streptomycetaceae bacterium]